MDWTTLVVAIAGLIATLLAGPVTEWRRRESEHRWARRNERRDAALQLLDAYTAWVGFILHHGGSATLNLLTEAELKLDSFNTALHRSQLIFGHDDTIVGKLDNIERRVTRSFQGSMGAIEVKPEELDAVHAELLNILRRELKD